MGPRAGLDGCGKYRHHRDSIPGTVQPLASCCTDRAIPARLNLRMALQSGTRPFPLISYPVRYSRAIQRVRCATDRVSTVIKYTTFEAHTRALQKSLALRIFQARRYQPFLHLTRRRSSCMAELCSVPLHENYCICRKLIFTFPMIDIPEVF